MPQIEKSSIVTGVPQALKDGGISGNDIRIIKCGKILVHPLRVLGLFEASHGETHMGFSLIKIARVLWSRASGKMNEVLERGVSDRSESLLDHFPAVSNEEGASAHGVNPLLDW